ncbi:ion transporter [Actinocorallia sp. API 0066]|uniref:ion transporter n=1 Tax=Actinocorallia sp. API 0066 TaxID=2896846 RepID=UPI001E4393ED|nr:ion transporter [Actinocorallia sp. API 0066]MCD0448576.1 ion transporter [Actinocorallia sp. API 0066]
MTRDRIRALVDARAFQRFIAAVIVVNAVTLGCETSPRLLDRYGDLLHLVDRVALAVFVVELGLRLYAHRLRFFRDPWNCFDLAIVGVALVPASGSLAILRSLRVLRALRLISVVPSMRRVVTALLTAIPGLMSITALLGLILYVAAVMATRLFASTDDEQFGDLGASAFTLFQIMTGDGWSDVARPLMDAHPWAWAFFLVYILISTFVILNLFIAITVSAMEPEVLGDIQEGLDQLDRREQSADALVIEELRSLRGELAALRKTVTDLASPAQGNGALIPAPRPAAPEGGPTDDSPAPR